MLLRPNGQKCTFVGEGSVDGVMDGERLVEARNQAWLDEKHNDTSWLNRLREEPIPFGFVIITVEPSLKCVATLRDV
jgi:hypothetical protein